MRSSHSFQRLYEDAACGLVLTQADGEIIHANATFCRYLAYDEQALRGKRIQDFFTVGGRFFHYTHWAPLLQIQGSVAEVQMDLVRSDGQALPMMINAFRKEFEGQFFHELSLFVATDRKKYEHELLRARKSAESTLHELHQLKTELEKSYSILGVAMRAAKMGFWSMQVGAETFWCSPELNELLGRPAASAELTFEGFLELVHPDDRSLLRAQLGAAMEQPTDYSVEFRLAATDASRLMELRGRSTTTENRMQVFGIVIDVTERREAESAVRKMNEELALADLRKDEFLATLAHELRNPLTPIHNVAGILKMRSQGDPQLEWATEVVSRQLNQLTHLIDDLMDVSRITRGRLALRKERETVGALIDRSLDIAQQKIEAAGHQLVIQTSDRDLFLYVDLTRMIQVITNILINAAKYTPSGGHITLWTKVSQHHFYIGVRDTGMGIPQDQLGQVFQMFSQLEPALNRAQGGLGIGLALSRGIVELHGGTITAESEGPGLGSQFTVSLPLAEDEQEKAQTALESAQPQSVTSQRVLIVDDNQDAAESLASIVELMGCQVCIAYDGRSALAKGPDFNPDIILLDIGLPDLNGYEVARLLRQAEWGARALLIAASGWGQQKDKQLAAEAGFDEHLTKPIDLVKLRKVCAEFGKAF